MNFQSKRNRLFLLLLLLFVVFYFAKNIILDEYVYIDKVVNGRTRKHLVEPPKRSNATQLLIMNVNKDCSEEHLYNAADWTLLMYKNNKDEKCAEKRDALLEGKFRHFYILYHMTTSRLDFPKNPKFLVHACAKNVNGD